MQLINVDDNGAIGNMTFITWCWCFYCSLILAQIIIFVFCHTLALAIILSNEFSVFRSPRNHLFLILGNSIIIVCAKTEKVQVVCCKLFPFAQVIANTHFLKRIDGSNQAGSEFWTINCFRCVLHSTLNPRYIRCPTHLIDYQNKRENTNYHSLQIGLLGFYIGPNLNLMSMNFLYNYK